MDREFHNKIGNHSDHNKHIEGFKQRFVVSLILTVPILLLSPMIWNLIGIQPEIPYRKTVIFILSTILYLYGGAPFLLGSFKEIQQKNPGMMTLISMAISVAFFYSSFSLFVEGTREFFWELATLIDIMLLGHYIEAKSVAKASNALQSIVQLIPKKAHKFVGSNIVETDIDQIKRKDILLVKPGEKIPCDAIVLDGRSLVDESFLSGESKPVQKSKGSQVFMGSTNLDGIIKIEVIKEGKESYLHQVIELVKEAQKSRSKAQDLANRASKWLFYAALGISGVTFGYWINVLEPAQALLMSVTVLIIACPHALGLTVPLVVAISTTKAAKNGILIKNKKAFENLKDVDTICFDKTGTLTEGQLFVEKVIGNDILRYAAALEKLSEHSLAKAIVNEANKRHLPLAKADNFQIFPGMGAKAQVEGKKVYIGNERLLQELGLDIPEQFMKYSKSTHTIVWVVVEKVVQGLILLSDKIRESAKKGISLLQRLGIETVMLTGDNEEVAKEVAQKLQIKKYFAKLLPDGKVEAIKRLKAQKRHVAMVGDGINDAPSLLHADIGIAIGAGTDITAQSADLILTKNSIIDVYKAILLSKATYKKMIQNLWWASGYNIIALPLAAGVLYHQGIIIEPAVGALFMSLSTVIVAINASLLNRVRLAPVLH